MSKITVYLKQKGIKRLFYVIYHYKLDKLIQKVILLFVKNKPLKDIIIIESHNDFDSNGGTFYDYLIRNEYNKKYKIVWLLKHEKPSKLPYNVEAYGIFKPSVKKDYYICSAKFLTADCEITDKVRNDQKSFYLTHGTFSLKNSHGKIDIPKSVDYILIPSEYSRRMQENQYNPQPKTELISIGFPVHDVFFMEQTNELKKITKKKYNKVIIWMPTFRKGGGWNRNDSNKELPLGIPLIESQEQYEELASLLRKLDVLLIIKIHPMQDLSTVKIGNKDNIKVLNGEKTKALQINNYQLLKETDALISDYSSIAYDYLMLERPIAYVFSDLAEYKNGLVTSSPEDLMAGPIIERFPELVAFIESITYSIDNDKERRISLRDRLYEYCDNENSKRLADFMKL